VFRRGALEIDAALQSFPFMWHNICRTERTASSLSKDDLIDMQGTVVAVHSGGLYRVQCDAGHEVLAQLSGRMRRFRIKVVPGDRVTVGVSPYDPVRGIITFRAR
jgi:translation initiation factor IF-1